MIRNSDPVSAFPCSSSGRADVCGFGTFFGETTCLLSGSSETAALSVFLFVGANPAELLVAADTIVHWIDSDDLEVFIFGVLTNPVGVEYAHVWCMTTYATFSNDAQVPLWFQVDDSSIDWFTIIYTFVELFLAATTFDACTEYSESLLGLVAVLAGLLSTGRAL